MKIYFGYQSGKENAYREINGAIITQDKAEDIFKEFLELVYGGKKTITNITSCAEREPIQD